MQNLPNKSQESKSNGGEQTKVIEQWVDSVVGFSSQYSGNG